MRSTRVELLSRLYGGTNFPLLLHEESSGALWVGKIFCNAMAPSLRHTDLNHRVMLAYRLAVQVGAALPETLLVDFCHICFSPVLQKTLHELDEPIIQDELLLVKFEGISLRNFLKIKKIGQLQNLEQLLHTFVFDLWIGNYDKKEADYVVNSDLIGHSVDHSLLGSGFVDDYRLSIGAYFQTYDFANVTDAGLALCDPLLHEVRRMRCAVDFFNPMIEGIERLEKGSIQNAFAGLACYHFGTAKRIDDQFLNFLLERQRGLRKAISEWCDAGHPKGIRIPEEEWTPGVLA